MDKTVRNRGVRGEGELSLEERISCPLEGAGCDPGAQRASSEVRDGIDRVRALCTVGKE